MVVDAVKMSGITKSFPGVIANHKVDFSLRESEVHGLLGENGAGKTTLMNVLYGLYNPDEGEIEINGKPVKIGSSNAAISFGIGMVHQHFQFVPRFTVLENFLLGASSPREPLLEDKNQVSSRIKNLSEKYQLPVDPNRLMWQLSVGEQQRIEILRALYRGAQTLILDEPTSVLTPQEVIQLTSIINALISVGKSVIFISHKLDEVMMMTHRVTVMRDGKVINTLNTKDTDRYELARMMVGTDIKKIPPREKNKPSNKPVLGVNALHVEDDRGLSAVNNVTLNVKPGEILGIAGVDGNGQVELEESIIGLRPSISGSISLNGKDITKASVRHRRQTLAYIPSDRYLRGIIRNFTVSENLMLGKHLKEPYSSHGFLRLKEINGHSTELVNEYQIRTPNISTKGGKLSGGNAQRLILARELSSKPEVIVACQPTRGLDVGAIEFVHGKLLEQRNSGVGVLLISADLDEVIKLSDRIAIIYQGRIMSALITSETKKETLGLLMAGVSEGK